MPQDGGRNPGGKGQGQGQGRGKGKGKGKGKGGSAASKEVEISKSLSYLLRHGAKDAGIGLDEGGWANVADVVGF